MNQLASVFQRPEGYYVHPSCQTPSLLWIAARPVVKLSATVQDAVLGETVLAALALSQTGYTGTLESGSAVCDEMSRLAQASTWEEFAILAKTASVSNDNQSLTIIAYGPPDGDGYFEADVDRNMRLTLDATAVEIGRTLREWFSRA